MASCKKGKLGLLPVNQLQSTVVLVQLVEVLLEELCSFYEPDCQKRRRLLVSLRSHFQDTGILPHIELKGRLKSLMLEFAQNFDEFRRSISDIIRNDHSSKCLVPISTGIEYPESILGHALSPGRYLSEFDEIGMLGTGGFGRVYKAHHKLDDVVYAVKKVMFRQKSSLALGKILREVRSLAQLIHPNIVNYKSAWLEPALNNGNYVSLSSSSSTTSSGGIDIEKDTSTQNNNNHVSLAVSCCYTPLVILYLQMELCDVTLRDWLKQRNDSMREVDSDLNIKILKQVLSGLKYIHSNKIVHRDIKPSNIFFSRRNQSVKIGDFGLAREVEDFDFDGRRMSEGDHTAGVGTVTYASPEQLQGDVVTDKCDMFSLGVIILEMYQTYYTTMERCKCIENLRNKGYIETHLIALFPAECSLVLNLTQECPRDRPSAAQVLHNSLFTGSTKDKMITLHRQISARNEVLEKELEDNKQLVESLVQDKINLQTELEEMKRELARQREINRQQSLIIITYQQQDKI